LKIAISQRVIENDKYPERRDALAQDWHLFCEKYLGGSILIPVPNSNNSIDRWFDAIMPEALILSGGNDLGENEDRDNVEKHLLHRAILSGIPILGVCRGMHLINWFLGGGCPIKLNAGDAVRHAGSIHRIIILKNYDQLFKDCEEVNSYHNMAIAPDRLAADVQIAATSEDGFVEAFTMKDKRIISVQWHPERNLDESDFTRGVCAAHIMGRSETSCLPTNQPSRKGL
jgi:putative glutamine amidotransferase